MCFDHNCILFRGYDSGELQYIISVGWKREISISTRSASGLAVKFQVAILEPPVRLRARAFFFCRFNNCARWCLHQATVVCHGGVKRVVHVQWQRSAPGDSIDSWIDVLNQIVTALFHYSPLRGWKLIGDFSTNFGPRYRIVHYSLRDSLCGS